MTEDLADYIEGTPGRFVPAEMQGKLVELEHLARYWWASGQASGKRVLDAGCGMAYGAAILARAGATSVVGVDIAEAVIQVANADTPSQVDCQVADVRDLPFDSESFDLVTCFEVIEHVDEQDDVIAELARVLTPGGTLLISSPNREAYVPGNPHHRHEYTPREFAEALARRFSDVALYRQQNLIGSAVLDDESATIDDGGEVANAAVRKLAEQAPDSQTYTLAVAGHQAFDAPRKLVVLADPLDVREWVERFRAQQHEFDQRGAALEAAGRGDRDELLARLAESEADAARLPDLQEQARTAKQAHDDIARERDELLERLARADRVLHDVLDSPSWTVTRPLRLAKKAQGRLRGGG